MIAATLRENVSKLNAVVSSSQQQQCPPRPYRSPQSHKRKSARAHAHTHTHARSLTFALNPIQLQTFEETGDTSTVGVRKVAATFTAPHPTPTLPWTNEAMISGVFIHVAIVQIHKVTPLPTTIRPHNFWIFSATTMGFSLRMRAAAALR